MDISCPCVVNVTMKESERMSKYGKLKKRIKMLGGDCLIISVVVGRLGVVSNDAEKLIIGKFQLNELKKLIILCTFWV